MPGYLDHYSAKGNHLLMKLAVELGEEDNIPRAARVLRSTLHALRRCLSIEASFHFIAQLPLIIKGIYVDGWKISHQERIKTWEEFSLEVLDTAGGAGGDDFSDNREIFIAVGAVLRVLMYYIPEDEMTDIIAQLPAQLKTALLELLTNDL
jgi:uncharacterized protein (DUF2267 family)